MTNNSSDKLTKLAQKIKILNNKKRLLEQSFKKDERKKDTRRKILLGSFVLYHLDKNENLKSIMTKDFLQFLKRDSDKNLFKELFSNTK